MTREDEQLTINGPSPYLPMKEEVVDALIETINPPPQEGEDV